MVRGKWESNGQQKLCHTLAVNLRHTILVGAPKQYKIIVSKQVLQISVYSKIKDATLGWQVHVLPGTPIHTQ